MPRPCGRGRLAQFRLPQRFAVWWVALPWPILVVPAVLLALCRIVDIIQCPSLALQACCKRLPRHRLHSRGRLIQRCSTKPLRGEKDCELARLPTASTTHASPCGGPARLDASLDPMRSAVLISGFVRHGGGLRFPLKPGALRRNLVIRRMEWPVRESWGRVPERKARPACVDMAAAAERWGAGF